MPLSISIFSQSVYFLCVTKTCKSMSIVRASVCVLGRAASSSRNRVCVHGADVLAGHAVLALSRLVARSAHTHTGLFVRPCLRSFSSASAVGVGSVGVGVAAVKQARDEEITAHHQHQTTHSTRTPGHVHFASGLNLFVLTLVS